MKLLKKLKFNYNQDIYSKQCKEIVLEIIRNK